MDPSLQTRGVLRTAPLDEDPDSQTRAPGSEPFAPCAPGQGHDEQQRDMRMLYLHSLRLKHTTEKKLDIDVLPSYPMKSEKRGTCLIINNENFNSMKKREGTMKDEVSAAAVFEWLNFEVKVHRDCDRNAILSIIEETAAEDHSQMDSLVCMIFSHGDEGRVFGVDGKDVKILELTAPFTGSKCPSLAGKPKMFFIQACQGDKNNDPVTIESDSRVLCDAVRTPTIPSEADFLLARSTVPNFYSYRNVDHGSWFIQSLCEHVFILVPREVDLLSILTRVNEDVSNKDVDSLKQMPEYVSSLRKRVIFPNPGAPPILREHQTDLDSTLQLLEDTVMTLVRKEVGRVQRFLSPDEPKYPDDEEEVKVKCDEEQMRSSREAFLDFIVNLLRSMKEEELAGRVWSRSRAEVCAGLLKRTLQKKFHRVSEGVTKAGNSAPLNQIYTELYITEGGTDQVNQEHEVRHIEAATRNQSRPGTTIRQEDLFKASPERVGPIRSLLTKGVAGIGKTLLTQKLTLDWAEDKAHQNFLLVFPFTFRELNLLKKKKLSLVELVHLFFPETKDSGLSSFEGVQVLFILDGLDQCRLPLDFNSRVLSDATESTSVDVLLTNLIRGKLLPSAGLWITTRPAAANQIPPECVDMVTEVRGFTDLQKEEYFRKRFRDEEQTTIIPHIRSSRSLYIMCHIPIFCWITATVLKHTLKSRETRELSGTLTEMYIHFLVVQAKIKQFRYDGGGGLGLTWDSESMKMIESLGKLAFEQLQRGNVIFYESDLTECGMDITAAPLYSGVFTEIFREERGLYQDKVFCFIHLSLQEFLAALHVHLKFFNSGVNLLHTQETSVPTRILRNKHLAEQFYHRAINKAVESPNGHLDLFLRFLLGLSLQTKKRLLPASLTKTGSSSWTHQDTAELIKKKINEKVSPERIINLFHCLSEVKDTSLVEEAQQQLRSGALLTDQLSHAQWSALAFILLSSEEDLEVFDLKKYSPSEEALERLLLVVRASKVVLLQDCQLSERSGSLLSSVLSSPSSRLTRLDLSYDHLKDSGVKLLCAGLKSPHCHLETLSLSWCDLSERSGSLLASVLSSPSSRLTQLDLSYNEDLEDSGVKLLCDGLKSPHCHLETLSLSLCDLSERSGSLLASVLSSSSSRLTQLDLSYNSDLRDPGVELLCDGLKSPHCHLETLSLSWCDLSKWSGSLLASVLSSPSSRLTQLDLSYNYKLKDPGVKLLCDGLKSPHCHLETLSLSGCSISERGCGSLALALASNPSHLRQLDLSFNHPGGPGLELLSVGVESPDWRLETLRLDHCGPQRLASGLKRYFHPLSLDPDTAHRRLLLSDNNMVELVTEDQDYLDHPERFGRCHQVMSRDAVTGLGYWEVEWRGSVSVAVTLRRDGGKEDESEFGQNPYSWSLSCSDDEGYKFFHNKRETVFKSSKVSHRIAVVVNTACGILVFGRVSSGVPTTLLTHFIPSEPLYLGFGIREVPGSGSSVRVYDLSV